jgi:uncharacterized repeat protein (TIGR03803 family)
MRQRLASVTICLLLSLGAAGAQPELASVNNKGKLSVLAMFGSGYGAQGELLEVTPGVFVGLAQLGATIFQLTSTGAISHIYTFPERAYPIAVPTQAANARIYGFEDGAPTFPPALFSLDLGGNLRTYPPVTPTPPFLTIALPDGSLYGAESSYNGNNAFERLTESGVGTVLHSFTTQEGIPHDRPIRASDGNFYGISHVNGVTSGMVYRITPQGDLTIMVTFPDGRKTTRAGDYFETLLQAHNGKLYGAAQFGGKYRAGSIFELSLDGQFKTLFEFDNWKYGTPTDLVEASDGNIYGVAEGQVNLGGVNSLLRISLAGKFERLVYIDGAQFGTCLCWLTQGSDGLIYGTTQGGGPSGLGTAFTWDLGLPKPKPSVVGVYPTQAAAGAPVIIWGDNLLGATGVTFNGTPATTFQSASRQFVRVTVPAGATSGKVTVTTMNGTGISRRPFTVE